MLKKVCLILMVILFSNTGFAKSTQTLRLVGVVKAKVNLSLSHQTDADAHFRLRSNLNKNKLITLRKNQRSIEVLVGSRSDLSLKINLQYKKQNLDVTYAAF